MFVIKLKVKHSELLQKLVKCRIPALKTIQKTRNSVMQFFNEVLLPPQHSPSLQRNGESHVCFKGVKAALVTNLWGQREVFMKRIKVFLAFYIFRN